MHLHHVWRLLASVCVSPKESLVKFRVPVSVSMNDVRMSLNYEVSNLDERMHPLLSRCIPRRKSTAFLPIWPEYTCHQTIRDKSRSHSTQLYIDSHTECRASSSLDIPIVCARARVCEAEKTAMYLHNQVQLANQHLHCCMRKIDELANSLIDQTPFQFCILHLSRCRHKRFSPTSA